MVESIAERMAATLKYGRPEASKAINRVEAPTYEEPTEPTGDAATRRGLLRFGKEWDQWWKREQTWKKNSGKIFEKLPSHCAPTMKTKLRGMEGWTDIKESQDGIKMVKLLHRVYFDTDGSKQSMQEMVLADKKLYLCFQKKEWTLDEYTREFQARHKVCEEIRSSPGECLKSVQLAASAKGVDYNELARSDALEDVETRKGYIRARRKQYLAALHFEGFNNVHFAELK